MKLGGEDVIAADGADVGSGAVGGCGDGPAGGFENGGGVRGEVGVDVIVL